jgi:PAS domain S-box-containing protein
MPAKTGMAFVLIQHLDPTHESMSCEILARSIQMPVAEVKEGMRVEPNHVYVIPSNTDMAIMNGILSLFPRTTIRGLHLPIDFFFQSLAQDQKTKAIGIVLSGTASDGTQGLKAIRAEGGITCAQDPKSAKYDGMPRSAIASGVVDIVLPPAQLAKELASFVHHPYIAAEDEIETPGFGTRQIDRGTGSDEVLRKIFLLLRKYTQVDFSNYKHTTVVRRIQRQMMVHKIEDMTRYVRFLQDHPKEVRALYDDVLIHVTDFFRDPESFKALKVQVFPQLIKDRPSEVPIRIWVAGCSTGEEAYSLAISLLEFLGDAEARYPLQIFATDISDAAIQKARVGLYPESISKHLSKDRLKRFFDKVEGGYKIHKSIRDCCLFSRHDVTSDPPFAKLDLVSCRNLLIYFEPVLQKRVIPVFHYALRPGGFLWLGRSESPGGFSKLFTQIDKLHKIYSKTGTATTLTIQFPIKTYPEEKQNFDKLPRDAALGELDFEKAADNLILSQYAPSGVIVNQEMEILQFRGKLGPYLEPATGQASLSLLKMVRPELLPGLRITLQSAKKRNVSVRKEGISFEQDKKPWKVNIVVTPINPLAPSKERRFLILFEDISLLSSSEIQYQRRGKKKLPGRKEQSQRLLQQNAELKHELKDTHEYQQSLAEDYKAAQEELTAANEELQSANEELQSSNEELETAKEELQSSNEELTTVNEELQNRNVDLTWLSNDLNNLLSSTDIPIVMVGSDHRIRKFTPKAGKDLNLIATDVGRPIGDIKPNFDLDLDTLVSEVMDSMNIKEVEIQDRQGKWSRVQIRPYKTIEHKIDGAVIALIDIGVLKQQLELSDTNRNYVQSVAETVQLPLVVLDQELRIRSANRSFYEHFHLSTEEVGDHFLKTLGLRSAKASQLEKLIEDTLAGHAEFKRFEIMHSFPQIGRRTILFSGRKINWTSQEPESVLLSLEDITEQHDVEVKLALETATVRLFEAVATAANEATSLDEALQIFLDRICAHTGWPVGHAYLMSDIPKGEFTSSKVWHLDDPSKFEHFRKVTEETPFTAGFGFPGQIVSTRKSDWTVDFSKDPILSRRILAKNEELKVAIAFPVPANKAVLAVLEFFSTNPKEPDQRLLALMTHISPQLGRVIERMHAEKERAELLIREQKARAEAEKGNRAKDLFLATLSHELRTPLTTILSWAQMLRMERLDPEKAKKGIEMIEQSAHAQGQLINDLLDVSRIIMDKLPLDLHPVDPAHIVRAAVDLIRPVADKKSIQIEMEMDPSTGIVSADPVRLQQVIWNLLTNAVKFSSEGKQIVVRMERTKVKDKDYARIQVVDKGKGISSDFIPHLFDRFSQADSSSTRIHGGLGLGLAIVRNLVELQGGTVEAESPGEGKGTTFTIKLPLLIDRVGLIQNFHAEAKAKTIRSEEESLKLDGLRVLLVDDEPNTCEALSVVLHSFGAKVLCAISVSEALGLLAQFKPHVLVSDIAMPGEDGYALIRKIRGLGPVDCQIPCVALTAYAGAEDIKRALGAGFQAHLSKPVDTNKLVGTIARLASESRNK